MPYRAFNITVLAVGALVTLAGMYDPLRASDGGRGPGWTILAVLSVLMVRSARLGLVVREDDVVIRYWFSTRRVPRRRIVDVSTTAYSGGWNRNGSSGSFKMLRLELVRGGYRDVQAIAGRPHRLRGLQHATHDLLELPGTKHAIATGRRREPAYRGSKAAVRSGATTTSRRARAKSPHASPAPVLSAASSSWPRT